jgi:peroxiredoxin
MAKTRKRNAKQKRIPNAVLIVGVIALFVTAAFLLINSFAGLDSSANPAAGNAAPSFTLTSVEGESVTVPDTNRQATVIFAMAYWCGTCIPEAQALARLNGEYSDALRVVLVDIDPSSSPQQLQQFVQAVGPNNMTWTFDTDGRLSRTYGIRVLDTTIILDGSGHEVYRDAYPTRFETLRDELERIIQR